MYAIRISYRLPVMLALFIVSILISCSKEGPVGPEGPAGPAGPKGDSGTSGVIYSDWLDVAFRPDTIHLSGGGIDTVGYYADVPAPQLSKALLSSADVRLYINAGTASDPSIYPLPYFNVYSGLSIDFSAHEQSLDMYSNGDMTTVVSSSGVKFQQFRYMIIPGNIKATASAKVNWSDYETVKAHLGLKD